MSLEEQFRSLSSSLEEHHALFYMMHRMGRPRFSSLIKTAAVRYDREGGFIDFLINQKFWDSLTDYERKFVVAHECLHVILNHGARALDTESSFMANVAKDIVVNHSLMRRFGFDRNKIRNWERYCWVETVFKDEDISSDETFEYYVFALKNRRKPKTSLVDDHEPFPSSDWGDVVKNLDLGLSHEEKQVLEHEMKKHGDKSWVFKGKVAKKRKWETVISSWSKKYMEVDTEQWLRRDRRHYLLDTNLLLPSEKLIDDEDMADLDVWFFQDTSGSCVELSDRFFRAAKSLPKKFKVKLFCFDTQVYEVNEEDGKLQGGSATSFKTIEDFIQRRVKKGSAYPKAVFVVTDGAGDDVSPEKPERWYWFLSSRNTRYIPEESHFHMLSDFD